MDKHNYEYIYGPVPSWRLGSSLGIDPISKRQKICTFNCVYCQLGSAGILADERKTFVPTVEVLKEVSSVPKIKIDYITFSGTGEPTLAANLGEMIRGVKQIRHEKVAVLTNSSLVHREDVMQDLEMADLVIAKLDASSQDVFEKVNRPAMGFKIDAVIRSIKDFKEHFKGRLALQVMFIEYNKIYAKEIACIAKEISPDEIHLNTPLRLCGVKPLTKDEMAAIEGNFSGLNTVSIYRAAKKDVRPISSEDTLKRRGKA